MSHLQTFKLTERVLRVLSVTGLTSKTSACFSTERRTEMAELTTLEEKLAEVLGLAQDPCAVSMTSSALSHVLTRPSPG